MNESLNVHKILELLLFYIYKKFLTIDIVIYLNFYLETSGVIM